MPDAPTAPDTGTETTAETEQAPPDTGADLNAEVAKWQALARKHEDRAKANAAAAKELETLRQQTMSDTEKAIEQAKAETRALVMRELGAERVDDALRLAIAGRDIDPDALLDGLDRGRFLTEDGQPDRDALTAWVDRIAPPQPEPVAPAHPLVPNLGQGSRMTSGDMALNGDPLLQSVIEKLKH